MKLIFNLWKPPDNAVRITTLSLAALMAGAVVSIVAAWITFTHFNDTYPLPLKALKETSVQVLDRNQQLLRVYPVKDGRWRLNVNLNEIDRDFREMLLAYEDKRFFQHSGIDFLAMLRAAGQIIINGRIVSGGSTLTMQLARLMEPRKSRSLSSKLWQMFRALQLEQKFSKTEILTYYLQLAPYGGNLEGIRAATWSYFGKEPRKLTLDEAALLVALPQSPETRRPDRNPQNAAHARARVIHRLTGIGLISHGEAIRIARLPVPLKRRELPKLAPHLADFATKSDNEKPVHHTTLDSKMQARLEQVALTTARAIGPKVSTAVIVADSSNGEILASIGSSDYFDQTRRGFIDMSTAIRSPGSTLKPLIYGLAIEEGLIMPETMISDTPVNFAGYRPSNFDGEYRGDISIREALQLSLNIPAIRLLEKIDPARLVARMRRAGVEAKLPRGKTAGLSIGLGGVGVSLKGLVQIYANLVSNASTPVVLGDGIRWQPGIRKTNRMISKTAAWHVNDMLAGAIQSGANPVKIAYKTGTSYGNRDAWSIGYDGRYVIGIWIGRADNNPVPGIMGGNTAAPVLFEAFEKSGLIRQQFRPAPAGAVRLAAHELPTSIRKFSDGSNAISASSAPLLQIAYPMEGAHIEIDDDDLGSAMPVVIKLVGGSPPFRLLANGKPVSGIFRHRQLLWQSPSPGFAKVTILDAAGQAKSIEIFVDRI